MLLLIKLGGKPQPAALEVIAQEVEAASGSTNEGLIGVLVQPLARSSTDGSL